MKKRALCIAALLAAVPSYALVAQDYPAGEGYEMVLTSVSEIGQSNEWGHRIGDGSLSACNLALKHQVLPRVVPRGNIISPGGNSYEWTVIEAKCRPEVKK